MANSGMADKPVLPTFSFPPTGKGGERKSQRERTWSPQGQRRLARVWAGVKPSAGAWGRRKPPTKEEAAGPLRSAVKHLQSLLGIGGKTRQLCSCRQFCVQALIARSSTPETAMSRLMSMSNGTEARQSIGSNLSRWSPAVVSAEAN